MDEVFPNRLGPPIMPISRHKADAGQPSQIIDAAGESAALIGRVHLTTGAATSKTISAAGGGKILWVAGATQTFSNGGTNLRIGINDVTGATGIEDGTHDVYADLVGGTDTITVSAVNTTTMEVGSKTIAHGDLVAVVIEMTTRGGTDSVRVAIDNTNQSITPYSTIDTGSGPGKNSTNLPFITIVFDDGTHGWLGDESFAWTSAANTAFNSGSTPDEQGLIVQYPWDFTAAGILMYLFGVGSADDFEAILYSDPLGTPAVIEAIAVDASTTYANDNSEVWVPLPFTTPREISRNTWYGIALRPTTANNVQLMQLSLGGAAARAVLPFGTNAALGTRTNQTGAFSTTTTLVPVFGLIPMSLADGTDPEGGSPGSPSFAVETGFASIG